MTPTILAFVLIGCESETTFTRIPGEAGPIVVEVPADTAPAAACPAWTGLGRDGVTTLAEDPEVQWKDGVSYTLSERATRADEGSTWSRRATVVALTESGTSLSVEATTDVSCDAEGAWVTGATVESWVSVGPDQGEHRTDEILLDEPYLLAPATLDVGVGWQRDVVGRVHRERDYVPYEASAWCEIVGVEVAETPYGGFEALVQRCDDGARVEDRWLDEVVGTVALRGETGTVVSLTSRLLLE